MTQNASVRTELTSDGYNHLRFLLLSYLEYIAFFSKTIQCYNLTQQYNYNMFLHLHTLYKSVGVTSPQHAANTSGGEFRSRSLQVFTASLRATRCHDGLILPSDHSSLSTSSQISSIKRMKRRVYYVQSHLPKLAVGGHPSCAEDRIIVNARVLTLAQSS
jgi:hypothetical protein